MNNLNPYYPANHQSIAEDVPFNQQAHECPHRPQPCNCDEDNSLEEMGLEREMLEQFDN